VKAVLFAAAISVFVVFGSRHFVLSTPRQLPQEDSIHFSTVEEIQDDFREVPCLQKERQPAVRKLLEKMGAPADSIVVEKAPGVENLVLRQRGETDDIVVIGAHYDLVTRGCGAIDNWSGIVAMAHIYRTMRQRSTQKTIVFAAFGREEEGLYGSKAMTRGIRKEELSKYCAMINIDSFGLANPFALENASTPSLMAVAKTSAEKLGISFTTVTLAGDSDSSSFAGRGIPAVTLSGLSNEWQTIIHSQKDQTSQVLPASVYLGYRLALDMSVTVDAKPCEAYREAATKNGRK